VRRTIIYFVILCAGIPSSLYPKKSYFLKKVETHFSKIEAVNEKIFTFMEKGSSDLPFLEFERVLRGLVRQVPKKVKYSSKKYTHFHRTPMVAYSELLHIQLKNLKKFEKKIKKRKKEEEQKYLSDINDYKYKIAHTLHWVEKSEEYYNEKYHKKNQEHSVQKLARYVGNFALAILSIEFVARCWMVVFPQIYPGKGF
jgi:hypothetical protein